MTTFEEAKRCPKCELPGEDKSTTAAKNSEGKPVKVHMIFCRNSECPWFDTSWIVQVNPDGSIPEAYSQLGPKQFPKVSGEMETKIRESIEAQVRAETSPGGAEITNPHGGR
jgi:hypothetical protein